MVQALKQDPKTAEVTSERRAMLDYVICLTETPWKVSEEHVHRMRDAGFSDQAIAVINLVACYFAWCNRIVDGLGVPLEDSWPQEVRDREPHIKQTPPGTPGRYV